MNQENTQKLLNRFPVLYQDYYSPMQHTCMCWGFDCGDGWFYIIWQLSLAIEEELGYSLLQRRTFLLKKRTAKLWNGLIYKLSPVRYDKTKMVGKGIAGDPLRHVVVEKRKPTWDEYFVRFFSPKKKLGKLGEVDRLGLKSLVWYPNTGFAVQQVKEKFGTLRFYCGHTDTISKLVNLAANLSSITCEKCGKHGELNTKGWMSTQCKTCRGE